MARISGMILGIGLLALISSLVSPAVAWDDDDDDDYKKRRRYVAPVYRHPIPHRPIYNPPRYVERHDYHSGPIIAPPPAYVQPQPIAPAPRPRLPLIPEPLPPSALEHDFHHHHQTPYVAPPVPHVPVQPLGRPGQFLNAGVPLYPHVRVKDGDDAPRFGVYKILCVQSPDPFRFPGCVNVRIFVPAGPCRGVKVKDGGAKIELDYGEYEVEVTSSRGVVTVEYDD